MTENMNISMIMSLVDRISGPIKKVVNSVSNVGEATDKVSRKFTRLRNEVDKFARQAKRLDGVGKPLAAIGTVGAAGLGLAVKGATDFETAMLGVAKQVEGARDKSGNLTSIYHKMYREVQLLGRELPIPTEQIAEMVASAARMGIARDELTKFVHTTAMMSSAFDLPGDELADQMGKIAKLFNIPIPEIGKLADVINYLDDNAISKGGDIIEVMKRIGGTAAFVKMPKDEAAALASTFLTLGSTAQVASTAANAVMRELSIATMQPKRFQAGLAEIGLTARNVQDDMTRDATGTILKVLDLIKTLPEEKRLTVATQLFGKEFGDDIAKLSAGVKEYRRQIELAKSADAVGSMSREHEARLKTLGAQWGIVKNRISEVAVNIGTVLFPAIHNVLEVFGGITSRFADFARSNKYLTGTLVAVTALTLVGGGLLMTIAAIGAATGPFLTGMAAMTKIFGATAFGIKGVLIALRAVSLFMFTNPIGIAIAAITGIATAAFLIYKNWGPITAFFKRIWASVVALAGKMREAGANLIKSLWDGIKSLAMKPVEAIQGIVKRIRNHLPFSPAKEGPLRDINRIRIVETIADTIRPDPMVKAMRHATAATMMAVATVPGGVAVGGEAGATINYAPVINLAPGTPADVRQQVDQALAKSQVNFERMFDQMMQQKQRRAY